MTTRMSLAALAAASLCLPACLHGGAAAAGDDVAAGAHRERDVDLAPALLECPGYIEASPNHPRFDVSVEFVVSEDGVVERGRTRVVRTSAPRIQDLVDRAVEDAEACLFTPAEIAANRFG
jgi:hypothetical protein